ncbi:Mov34/MPN/PAD-1 family protein [Bradyrhizobium tunisiense]|uniref:Mov34/MPN/PAD-1 family protein n=1 Tax=Bradyrhizobium tunisiense TaxID=3278709 RepID=UPI0035DF38BC
MLYSMRNMEACCFWFGLRPPAGAATVSAILVPRQQNHRGHYHVEADAMIEIANAARGRGWKNVAQVHSHPGPEVTHSGYDDEMANSRRALSLVFPNYGYTPGMWRFRSWLSRLWPVAFPEQIGVHAFLDSRWRRLSPNSIGAALSVTAGPSPELIDLRP